MMPVKSVFLKTYGKQKRTLSAWISTENHKEAFDSTFSSDGDISVFEPAKPLRIRERRTTAKCRPVRPAKKKATLHLKEKSCDEESIRSEENDIIPALADPQAAQTTRGKKKGVWRGRTVVPSKREAMLSLTENSSEEENICPSSTLVSQGSKNTRKTQLVSVPEVLTRQRGQKIPLTSESDGDSKCHKKSVQMKRESNIHPPPSVGRFVTRRRRGAAAKPKLSKAVVHILNSSDDFAAGAFCPSNACQPSGRVRKKKRRKVLSAFLMSSAENSLNTVGTSSFATNPLKEISLNESADHILGPCNRKPIFCSTPSAGSFSNRPSIKPFPINDKSTPSMSISCIGALSPFQKDLNSPGQCVGPLHSAPLTGLHSGEKLQSSLSEQEPDLHHHDEEPSGELFMEPEDTNRRSSCGKETKSHAEASETENGGTLPSLNLLSMDSESSSDFVSAAGGLAWLIEALKEKCLTERCTVQLERSDNLTVTQLCSQTTYSSCLGLLSSAHSNKTNEHLLSVDSNQTAGMLQPAEVSLSVTNNKTRDDLQSVNSFESSQQAASVSDSLSSVNCKLSAECSSPSAFYDESSHHKESSVDLTAKSPVQQLFTEEEAVAVQDKYVTKKCAVQLKKLSIKLCTGSRTRLSCDDASVNTDQNKSENDNLRDLTCSGESTEGMCVMLSTDSSSPPAQAQSTDTETEEKTAVLTEILKEQCVSDKLAVKMKRLSLSQLKNILQLKGKKLKSPTVVSDSASDEQIKTDHQSESDANPCDENTSVKVNVKKRCSTVLSSEDKIASNKEEVVKRSRDSLPKRKKTSLAARERKRRSTSTDRPGTTRKACVSGLSVSRWKNKSNISTHMWAGGVRPVDCSINELIPTQHKPPMELGSTINLSTPVRANQHNLSSLLAQFTPNTHTWSRLKAALSVHRKGMVFLTPHSHLSGSPVKTGLSDLSQDLFATPFRTPLPKHLRSQLKTPSLDVTEDEDLSDAEKVYAECGQERPLSWEECILPHRMKQCVKIGEGTFGEVFSTTNASGDTVALKIIPVEGSEKVNGEDQKTFGEILHEIIISKELSSLKVKPHNQTRGFIGLNDLHCARGCYPPDFLKAWDKFDQQKGSENDRPDFFEKDQLFIILEFEFGGIDLENTNGKLASLGVAKSILHQVTAALAVAEQELHFEHRDLHWGNVLVKTTKQKTGSFLLNGKETSLETKGVLVRIIDYSLSRLEIDELTVSCDISNDEELFMGQGDYQFDIYRLMRQENGNNWSDYRPHTNVLWLHYLCSKLMSMKYRGNGGRVAKDTREELTRFYNNVLHYGSAFEVLQNCPMFQ